MRKSTKAKAMVKNSTSITIMVNSEIPDEWGTKYDLTAVGTIVRGLESLNFSFPSLTLYSGALGLRFYADSKDKIQNQMPLYVHWRNMEDLIISAFQFTMETIS